jgi:DNA-binding transcriptional LysR family regulator
MNSARRTHLPSLQALMCFEASERLGSFTRAAAELHLTQGAISRQILALEQLLQTRLFQRNARNLALTAGGRTYLAEIRPLLRRIERATTDLASHHGLGGRLRLSVTSSFATHWLVPRLPSFTEQCPDVTLDLSTRVGPVDFSIVDVDAAITFIAQPAEGTTGARVLPLKLRAYASRARLRGLGHRGRALDVLQRIPLLQHSTIPEAWGEWALAAGADPALSEVLAKRAGPRYDLMSMALNAAIVGVGAALLPDYLAAPAVASGRLSSLSRTTWTATKAYHLTYPNGMADLPALQRFEEWLLGQVSTKS